MADDAEPQGPERITAEELRRRLLDPSVPEADLRPYLLLDESRSRAFAPSVRVNPSMLMPSPPGSALSSAPGGIVPDRLQGNVAVGGLNDIARLRRKLAYRARIAGGWTGLRIVSEGDSWFQYPLLLDDVIDHLMRDHAVFSLDAAGDTLGDMIAQDEVVAAVLAERPHVVLLSGGGNDLVGGGRLATVVRTFDPRLSAAEHVTPAFETLLQGVVSHVRQIVMRIGSATAVPVLIHCYDHAVPNRGRWLGRPLETMGIMDRVLQGEIVGILIDRYAEALIRLAQEPSMHHRFHVVDSRGLIPRGQWNDELHPTSKAFGIVAEHFRRRIAEVTARHAPAAAMSGLAIPSAQERDAGSRQEGADGALGDVVTALADTHDEGVLIAEIGRRAALERVQPAAASSSLAPEAAMVASSSLEGGFEAFRTLGARILARAHRELFGMLCGSDDGDKADRASLRAAFDIGSGAVAAAIVAALSTGPLGLSAFVAAPVAAILVRRFIRPGWEETCTLWGEALDRGGTTHDTVRMATRGLHASKNTDRFCMAFTRSGLSDADARRMAGSRAALLEGAKWPLNSLIKIRFLGGSDQLKQRVRQFADLWVEKGMAALTFKWIVDGKADVRIAFEQGNGSWSLLGTECQHEHDQTKPTMNFGWLTDASGDVEIREVVLHEFGHALALIHEHQNPEGGIDWNEAEVMRDLSGPPNLWDEATIRHNVLDHYDPAKVKATGLDPHSIMMYPIPNRWTKGDFETGMNTDFSETDRRHIRDVYP